MSLSLCVWFDVFFFIIIIITMFIIFLLLGAVLTLINPRTHHCQLGGTYTEKTAFVTAQPQPVMATAHAQPVMATAHAQPVMATAQPVDVVTQPQSKVVTATYP